MSYGDGPGFDSEELIKELLQACGWGVRESRKAADEGRAPMLEMDLDSKDIRVPDFQVHHPRHAPRYVEVKSFKKPRVYGVKDSVRHGYENRKHEDYLEFKKLAEHPVYIFIHERKPGVVLRQQIQYLHRVQILTNSETLIEDYDRDNDMAFFERQQFQEVTDDISQFAAGFGQSGLIQDDITLSPFGLDDDSGSQGDLEGWA